MNIEVSDEVRARLQQAMSDNEACAILVEAGVDVEAIERELADEQLENVAGGWEGIDREFECPWCHEKDREMVSRQFWASLLLIRAASGAAASARSTSISATACRASTNGAGAGLAVVTPRPAAPKIAARKNAVSSLNAKTRRGLLPGASRGFLSSWAYASA